MTRSPAQHDAAVERTARDLWPDRAGLAPEQQTVVEALPEPYRAAFEGWRIYRLGRRLEALEMSSRVTAAHPEPTMWRSALLRQQAAVYADLHLVEPAIALNTECQEIARHVGDTAALASAIQDLAQYPHQSPERTVELLTEARDLVLTIDVPVLLAVIDFNLAVQATCGADTPQAVLDQLESVEDRMEQAWPGLMLEARADRTVILVQSGRSSEASDLADRLPPADDSITDLGSRVAVATARAWVLADRGRVDDALEVLEGALDIATASQRISLLGTQSEVLGHAGRYAAAWRASQELAELTTQDLDQLGRQQAAALWIWYGIGGGRTDDDRAAARTIDALREELREARREILRLRAVVDGQR